MRTVLVAAFAALTLVISAGSVDAAVAAQKCGGFIGIQCPAGQFCQHQAGTCFFADTFGTCRRVPRFCPKIFRPVCGCDGKTYPNDCVRETAMVSKSHDGKCAW
jgi:Kazal-type serine protease inhibitor-like protein